MMPLIEYDLESQAAFVAASANDKATVATVEVRIKTPNVT